MKIHVMNNQDPKNMTSAAFIENKMGNKNLSEKPLTEYYSINGIDWYVYRRMLMPIPGPDRQLDIEIDKIRKVVFKHNLIGAAWTYDWDCKPTPWYWIVCDDKEYDMSKLKSFDRRDIRRGLKRTEVRQCSMDWIAEHGYEVYQKAFDRYKFTQPKDYAGFYQDLFKLADVAQPEGWCVFHKGELIAWLSVYIKGNAAFADDLKFDPAFRSVYPTNAVFYVITQHYLLERKCDYITAGARNVNHHTGVQDFLVGNMGWRKVYTRLALWLRPEVRLPLIMGAGKLSNWMKNANLFTSISRTVNTAYLLWQIAQACKNREFPEHLKGNLGT